MADYASPEEIQAFLEGVTYPISTRTLLETAREQGASEQYCGPSRRSRTTSTGTTKRSTPT